MTGPPALVEAEENLLGSLLVMPVYLSGVLAEVHLHPEHFYLERHGLIFRRLVDAYEANRPIDELSIAADLESAGELERIGGRNRLAQLAAEVRAPGNALHHASLILEKAEWRRRIRAGQLILQGAQQEDRALLSQGEEMLNQDLTRAGSDFDPRRLADVVFDVMDKGGVEAFPYPFEKLNRITAGGIRRGELAIVAGHTSHGKSVLLDQTLEAAARRGARCRLYMNEMALVERVARTLTRRTEVDYAKIMQGRLSEEEGRKVVAELNRGLPYGITYTPGWTADEISHHMRAHRWDAAGIDILQEIDYEHERDLSRMVSLFARTAKQAETALLLASHLNEKRVQEATRPRPTLGDLRGSGQIKNAADTVLFVYRKQQVETGEPQDDASIYFGKTRNGPVGGMRAKFNGRRLRFEVAS